MLVSLSGLVLVSLSLSGLVLVSLSLSGLVLVSLSLSGLVLVSLSLSGLVLVSGPGCLALVSQSGPGCLELIVVEYWSRKVLVFAASRFARHRVQFRCLCRSRIVQLRQARA
ncbi:hypothetical protein HWV07_15605 [Natronomonas salina]|uniref:hypothetical protein n=1 Tax=Natronomonas salina TaxID=1710540 RepID=UPI0015B5EEF2|nr:hypothetical protein [Natronomonas salina]QLD90383.1 hypothetical protein HWV07_15605 [Natronomonas salina]